MNIKDVFIILVIIVAFFVNNTNAWLGLIAENGDLLNISKWNEMIVKLNLKLEQSNIVGGSNIDVTNSATGVIISFTGGIASSPIPYIDSGELVKNIIVSSTKDINLSGINFTPSMNVIIPGWPGTINSISINSPTNLDINITSISSTGTYDIILSNLGVLNTVWPGNGIGLIKINPLSVWIDLRSGGDVFTDGNATGNDIRYRSGMSMIRDANGIYFIGVGPWSSWVKFENLSWFRGDNRTLEWIFTSPTSPMMLGIGSTATNEASSAQYSQAEVEMYFNTTTSMWGLYGNNGNIGTSGSQLGTIDLSSCTSNVFKGVFTNDGSIGGQITLYCLPTANQADWDNVSNVLGGYAISGNINPNQSNIMPFIIPSNGGAQRFVAIKLQ